MWQYSTIIQASLAPCIVSSTAGASVSTIVETWLPLAAFQQLQPAVGRSCLIHVSDA
jgi:hypothetical protein